MASKKINWYIYLGIAGTISQWSIFKQLYPTADYTHSSYNYLAAAISGSDFSLWPIAYSKFLYFFHTLTSSDVLLTTFQYAFLEGSSLFLFLTIFQLFNLQDYIARTLFIFLIFNPIFLYISNYVLPDSLFIALSLLWMNTLLSFMTKPRKWHLVTHITLLILLMTLKHQALYYPVISVVAINITSQKLSFKVLGTGLAIFSLLISTLVTASAAKRAIGAYQPLAILGWNTANNALYVYPHINTDELIFSPRTNILNDHIKNHFAIHPPTVTPLLGTYYLYAFESPLRKYLVNHFLISKNITEEDAWCQLAPVVFDYGKTIILKHPWEYVRYYLIPNTVNYFFPLTYEFTRHNSGETNVRPMVKEWFKYKDTKIACTYPRLQGKVFHFFSATFLMLNIIILLTTPWIVLKKKLRSSSHITKISFVLIMSLYGINTLYSIAVCPVDLTAVLFPLILYMCFILTMINSFNPSRNSDSIILGPLFGRHQHEPTEASIG
jgi:hypothetical protein